jgi:hypothetical protein
VAVDLDADRDWASGGGSGAAAAPLVADAAFEPLEDLAETVLDVVPLAAATEFAGRVVVQKAGGQWWRRPTGPAAAAAASTAGDASFLYNLHDSGVRFYR